MTRHKTAAALPLDPQLVGRWTVQTRSKEITPDGWYWGEEPELPYTISADGQTLDFPGTTTPWTFARVYGTGASIVGMWTRDETDGGILWTEEWLYRADGSYTMQWRADGVFDSEYQGSYSATATHLATRDRQALIVQTAPADLEFQVPFGGNFSGSYVMAADGSSFELTMDGASFTYTRLP